MARPRGLMHLMTFTLFCPNQHSFGEWRYPLTVPNGFDWSKPAVWGSRAC